MAAPMKTDEAGTPQQKKHALVVSSQTLGQQGKSKSSKKAKQSTAKKKKYLKAPFKYEWQVHVPLINPRSKIMMMVMDGDHHHSILPCVCTYIILFIAYK